MAEGQAHDRRGEGTTVPTPPSSNSSSSSSSSLQPSIRRVELRAAVAPSEDPLKVLTAMQWILGGDCDYSLARSRTSIRLLSNSPRCLQRLHDQLRDRHVRDAARRLMLRLLDGSKLTIMLNRQAATAEVVALCTSATESPLGPLTMEVESDDPQQLIDWLTAH
jgi:predicted RNA binding protein with dsRBD fold (UPF0201 family)